MSIAPRHVDCGPGSLPRSGRERWTYSSVSVVLRALETVAAALAAAAATYLRFDQAGFVDDYGPDDYGILTALGVACFVLFAQFGGAYQVQRLKSPFGQVSRVLAAWTLSIAAVLVICFAAKTTADYSRLWIGAWWAIGAVAIGAIRIAVVRRVRTAEARGQLTETVLIVGDRPTLSHTTGLIGRFDMRIQATIRVATGIGGDDDALRTAADAARAACAGGDVDRILLAPSLADEALLAGYVAHFKFLPVETIMLPPDQTLERALDRGTDRQLPVLEVVARRPLDDTDRFAKRMFDCVAAAGLLALLSPLLLVIAAAVRVQGPGPVFFRQQRSGFGGHVFTVYKFRTMHAGACAAPDVPQARRGDPRVTSLGRFLRRTSLDELPQLANVVRGEMSLVGPRPHALAHDASFAREVDSYMARHRVKPGMTGLAQVKGFRGEIADGDALRQRIGSDLWYIENWSILLDIKILVMTAFVLTGRNAY